MHELVKQVASRALESILAAHAATNTVKAARTAVVDEGACEEEEEEEEEEEGEFDLGESDCPSLDFGPEAQALFALLASVVGSATVSSTQLRLGWLRCDELSHDPSAHDAATAASPACGHGSTGPSLVSAGRLRASRVPSAPTAAERLRARVLALFATCPSMAIVRSIAGGDYSISF
jgi:hypothetical protein